MIETVDDIKTIANVGTGTMGHAITLQFALAGYPVHLVGRGEASLEKAMKAIRSDAEDFAEAGLLKDGDTVAIPDDVTNGGRALKVLEATGLIKLKDSAEFNPTIDDIETYNTKITIEELKANVIPSTLADVTAAVVNGNYALDFGLKTEDAIYKDDQLDIEEYWNLIAARSADLEDADKLETYKKVVAAFQSDETEKVFNDQFGGYFIKAGWDQDLLADK